MNKIITYERLRDFCYSNDLICRKPIKGIVLYFFGLGTQHIYSEDTEDGKFFAEKGILYIVPYTNPWAWMNRQAVSYVNEIVDVVMKHYDLPDDIPLVSTGGSMGGQQGLAYMAYAAHTPVACVVNCPVCDLPYHFTERPDLPRTLYSAFGLYEDMSLEQAMESASPLHLTDRLPRNARYYIFHCEEDKSVNIDQHSARLIKKMAGNFDVTYHTVPGKGHCDLTPEMWDQYHAYICENICG